MIKLFITGATGYIGGDALYTIANTYPDLEITAIVRNSDKGAKVAAQYPKIRLVYGNLDSLELLATESAKADIVLHTADCDHEASASAIVAGFAQKKDGEKGYLIHTSGTGTLWFSDFQIKSYGQPSDKVYDDWDGIGEATSLPDTAPHRPVDKIILAASTQHPTKVNTAIVCPPTIYGPGRGPDNQKSQQVYSYARAILQRGKGFTIDEGKNRWTEVHVQDLSDVYLALVTAAMQPGGGKATWNDKGYYYTETGEFVWGDIGREIAKAAKKHGHIESDEMDRLSPDEVDKVMPNLQNMVGMNSRARAVRARKVLGWSPKQKSLVDVLPDIVDLEAKGLGIAKGHAAKAAGEA